MENSLEENEIFANDVLKPIMKVIDDNIHQFDLDKLKGTIQSWGEDVGIVEAFPFEEMQNKAEEDAEMIALFKKVVELIELRKKQIKGVRNRSRGTTGDQILKQLMGG